MAETGEGSHIEVAGKYSSIEDLRRKAQEKKEVAAPPKIEVKVDIGELAHQVGILAEGQRDLLGSLEKQSLSIEQFLRLSEKQSGELVESLRGTEPKEERQRWVDAEYSQQFYTRFTPNLEPKFYQKLDSEQRRKFDARWQLARTAFVKRATAGLPDKYRENQELELLGKEQMETLYNIPGVKPILEAYARAITKGETVIIREYGEEKEISFWDIKDMDTFEVFRGALRNKALRPPEIQKSLQGQEEYKAAQTSEVKRWWLNLYSKEADAIAWNWLWVGNLAESADSRYSWSGGSSSGIPGAISAGEYKYVLHPQERFEGKSLIGHYWGAFGKWGVTQASKIKKEAGFNGDKDEILFLPGKRSRYWSWKLARGLAPSDEKKKEKGGRVFKVYTPECYPVTSCRSFWEETSVEVPSGRLGKPFVKQSLLEYLTRGERISWDEVAQDAWAIYMYGKFDKAVKLLSNFNPEKPLDIMKAGWAYEWANPLLELYTRLKPEEELKKLKEGIRDERKPLQTFSQLKAWAFYASIGGVKNVNSRMPTINLGPLDAFVADRTLRGGRVGYLTGSDSLNL